MLSMKGSSEYMSKGERRIETGFEVSVIGQFWSSSGRFHLRSNCVGSLSDLAGVCVRLLEGC